MIFTQHNDNFRTGTNLLEKNLTTANVNPDQFGKLFERFVDGSVYAQPLVVPNVLIRTPRDERGRRHNVLFVATMHNSVFAFDPDQLAVSGALWHRQLASSVQLPDDDIGPHGFWSWDKYKDMEWEVGIVGTPVIDTDRGALYVVTTSRQSPQSVIVHQIWKLDLSTGNTLASEVIAASMGERVFVSHKQLQRAALLLVGDQVYVAFASYADEKPYNGWLLSYDADTLKRNHVFCVTPQGGEGEIWQAGQGPAADADGNIYFLTGNGDFKAENGNFGGCALKLSADLGLLDFFAPHNVLTLNGDDCDVGSGGLLLIPGTSLMTGGGKESVLYLMDRNNLGGHNGSSDNIVQRFRVSRDDGRKHHIHGSPVFWNGPDGPRIYLWPENDFLKAYSFNGAEFNPSPISHCTITQPENVAGGSPGMPGGFLTISANGSATDSGIVWANHPWNDDLNNRIGAGVLRAFDAHDLGNELWNSHRSASRDDFGNFAKCCPPVVANGQVYQATMAPGWSWHGAASTIRATST